MLAVDYDVNVVRDWLDTATLVTTLILAVATSAGVVLSLYFSRMALREVQTDRDIRLAPHLVFISGAQVMRVYFRKVGRSIPGMDPEWCNGNLHTIPVDCESVSLSDKFDEGTYGKLVNYGQGAALQCEVEFYPEQLVIGSEMFVVDDSKRSELIYSAELNTVPVWPHHLRSGDDGKLTRLPSFIVKDYERKITSVFGKLRITCVDSAGREHAFAQVFRILTDYEAESPTVTVTLGETVPNF